MSPSNDPRAELQEEVTRRVRPVCPDIPADELRQLVARLVDAELSHRRSPAASVDAPAPATVDGG